MSLNEKISKEMGWWAPDGFDAYPEKTEKVLEIIRGVVINELNQLTGKGVTDNKGVSFFIDLDDIYKRIKVLSTKKED